VNLKHVLLMAAILPLSPGLWAQTYTYTGMAYTTLGDFTSPCATGPCANYAPGQKISGHFMTASPLPPNLVNANIFPNVTSFSFTDGVNTYSSSDANSRAFEFQATTDPGGNITDWHLQFDHWQTGSDPHSAGNRSAILDTSLGGDTGVNDADCVVVAISSPLTGVADVCNGYTVDASTSFGGTLDNPGSWSFSSGNVAPPAAVPTLSDCAMLLLSLVVAGAGVCSLGRRSPRRVA
jgi:hypothetical protein